MKKIKLGGTNILIPSVIVGCMRLGDLNSTELNSFIHLALERGCNFFDHADIYANGYCEELFGDAVSGDNSIKRENLILQSKCGICNGYYDLSKEHILSSVDKILQRLKTDYLDILLLHRPDALVEPEEVAEAFDLLQTSGKVRLFGVSNHNSGQIELLQKHLKQNLIINQLQLSIAVSGLVSQGLEVNMETPGSINRDGSVLDYCRNKNITIQAWSPFQMPSWQGCFIGNPKYEALNNVLRELSLKYGTTPTGIAGAWILRHPAGIQLVTGTKNPERLKEITDAAGISLSREDWYRIYLSAGHILP